MSKLIELLIDENEDAWGVEAISLVKFPAIEENFVFFSKQGNTRGVSLAAVDEEQQVLVGAALIPDKNIPRYDEATDEEYEVFFSKETVKLASQLYIKQNRTNNHTREHQESIDEVSVVESWIVEDPELDKSKLYGLSMPQGTWMVKVHVANNEVWQEVKAGKLRGFSIEGYFADKIVEMQRREMESFTDYPESASNNANKVPMKQTKMQKTLKKMWFAIRRKFYNEVSLQDGTVIATEDDALTAGSAVFKIDEEGLPTELGNGKYTTEGGVELEVFEGVLTEYDGEVKAVEEKEEEVEKIGRAHV